LATPAIPARPGSAPCGRRPGAPPERRAAAPASPGPRSRAAAPVSSPSPPGPASVRAVGAAADPDPGAGPRAEAPAASRADRVDPGGGGGDGPGGSGRTVLDETRIRRALMRIAHEIAERNPDPSRLYLVAIPNGGVPLGRRLVENLRALAGVEPPLGTLDTTLYRDDLVTTGARPRLRRTEMPSSVDGRTVILVEDVVNTGRTIRAAMDALMDFGRPSSVQVVALVDRGHRELPIKIDYVGKNIPTHHRETVTLRGPDGTLADPLEVVVETPSGEPEEGRRP